MTSSPLLTSVAELMVTTGPIAQVGWASACVGRDVGHLRRGAAAERAAGRGDDQPGDLAGGAAAQALGQRAVLGIDRHDLPGRGRVVTSEPPATSDSLLASARIRPARSAARVGSSPIEPVMPLSTMSASTDSTSSVAARSPVITAGAALSRRPDRRRRRARRPGGRGLRGEQLGFAPPAASPTTSNLSGWAAMTSSAWVPIEPVEPSRMIRRRPGHGAGSAPAPRPGVAALSVVTATIFLPRPDRRPIERIGAPIALHVEPSARAARRTHILA